MTAHISLQRLVVRLLYDPDLVRSLYADPHRVLSPLHLPAGAQSWLLAIDHRSWGIDTLRRSRALFTLLEEFPASATVCFQQPNAAAGLDRFFSSEHFHRAVQRRASMALAFGIWWRQSCDEGEWPRETSWLLEIELCIAELRRATDPDHGSLRSPDRGEVMTHPAVGVIRLPIGVLSLYAHVLEAMGPGRPLEPVIRGEVALSPLPDVDLTEEESLLVDPSSQGGGVGSVDDSLADLLLLANAPISRETLFHEMLRLGAEQGEQGEIVEGLIEDGLLVER